MKIHSSPHIKSQWAAAPMRLKIHIWNNIMSLFSWYGSNEKIIILCIIMPVF